MYHPPDFHWHILNNTMSQYYLCYYQILGLNGVEIVKHLEFYPEETNRPASDVWQTACWMEFKPCEHTLIYALGLKHFYIDEVCALKYGQLVIPLAWISYSGQLCGDFYLVTVAELNLSLYLLAKLTSVL
jgi:hypothetical protein